MDSNNKKHLIVYILVAGFFFYLLSAMLSAIFIVSLPQDKNFCLETYEEETSNGIETNCIKFKSGLEELKYYYNKSMVGRNTYIIAGNFILALLITLFIFHFVPKWRGKELYHDNISSVVLLTFIVSIIAPLIFGWLLPPPVNWFPQVFRDINDAQIERELKILRSIINY